jgi:integrase
LFRRARYQRGSLQRAKRKSGPAVWIFRWYEVQAGGRKAYRKRVVGTVEDLKTEADARKALDALRITVNQESRLATLPRMNFETLVSHYREKELPEDRSKAKVPKAHSTTVTYQRYLRKWILPRWKNYPIRDIQSIAVEDWLFGLSAANGTKTKIRNIMSAAFRHAIRHGFLPRDKDANPMRYVRQTAASEVSHTILTVDQVIQILSYLREPCRTMAFLDAATGLRISELLALKWADINFEALEINVHRAIVYGVIGRCKSKASKKPVPLDPFLAEVLWKWRLTTPYNQSDDWVFASPKMNGRKPYLPGMLIRWHLRPAAERAGVEGRIGWHTFRRTVATLLVANGEDVKTVQESLRHANSKVTLDLYAQALTPTKRKAQSKIVQMLIPAESNGSELAKTDNQNPLTNPYQTLGSEAGHIKLLKEMVARDGIEPPTPAFSARTLLVAFASFR